MTQINKNHSSLSDLLKRKHSGLLSYDNYIEKKYSRKAPGEFSMPKVNINFGEERKLFRVVSHSRIRDSSLNSSPFRSLFRSGSYLAEHKKSINEAKDFNNLYSNNRTKRAIMTRSNVKKPKKPRVHLSNPPSLIIMNKSSNLGYSKNPEVPKRKPAFGKLFPRTKVLI